MNALVIAQAPYGIEADQVAPFLAQRSALSRELGLQISHIIAPELADKREAIRKNQADLIFIQTSWREKPEDVSAFFSDVHSSAPPLVYLDSFDSTATPFFAIAPYVALYVKKQLLNDAVRYTQPMAGGFIFTDYLSRHGLFDIGDWNFGSILRAADLPKLFPGWNLGMAPHLLRQFRRAAWWPFKSKQPIDLSCRSAIRESWYGYHRQAAVDATAKLRQKYDVIAEGFSKSHGKPISPRQYQRELRQSKMSLSPFGWGEICYRDFESIINHSLMVKPDMSHISTFPNLYLPDETYVPVKWDFSDLEQQCEPYLSRPQDRQRIIENAWQKYKNAVAGNWFVPIVQKMIDRVKINASGENKTQSGI